MAFIIFHIGFNLSTILISNIRQLKLVIIRTKARKHLYKQMALRKLNSLKPVKPVPLTD